MMILAGDIGGTKTNLAWFQPTDNGLQCLGVQSYPSQNFSGLEPVIDAFLSQKSHAVSAAAFGIAGPVVEGRTETTNLPWIVDTRLLQRHLGVTAVGLINDLEATGYGISALRSDEIYTLQSGTRGDGNGALIAAGTGLGEALLFWHRGLHIPSPSEGGHCDFGPRNAWEIGLLQFLSQRYGHVSYERILSGHGFVDLYDYVVSRGGTPTAEVQAARESLADPAPIISKAGLEQSCPVCVEVMDHFIEIYGAEASNMALKALAVSGVYIGGGIAPRIVSRMVNGAFLKGFLDKGRFQPLLRQMPLHIILNPHAALLGAARYAALLRS